MSHARYEERLAVYPDLAPREREEVDLHVNTCAACAALLADYQALRRTLQGRPSPQPSDRLRQGFADAVARARAADRHTGPWARLMHAALALGNAASWAAVGAVAVLLLVGLAITGPELARRAWPATLTPAPAASGQWVSGHLTVQGQGTYTYRLLIPPDWAGRYEVSERGNTVSFSYTVPADVRGLLATLTPTPGLAKPNPSEILFWISILTDAEWQAAQREPGTGSVIGTLDGVVIVRGSAIANNYSAFSNEPWPQVADEFQRMAGQVPAILESLEVTSGSAAEGTPTPVAEPTVTVTPRETTVGAVREPPPPRLPAVDPIANPFERQHLPAGTTIAQAGLYFMDVTTGEIEAWSLPGEEWAQYSTTPDNRWLVAYTPGALFLADRQGSAAYRWQREGAALLAAQGNYLLLGDRAGPIWLTGPGQPQPIALPIKAAGAQAAISPTGQTAAVLSAHTLYLVQLADGACRTLGQVVEPDAGSADPPYSFLRMGQRAEAITVVTNLSQGSGATRTTTQRVARYSWQGERLLAAAAPSTGRYAFSPDGRLVAWEERLSHLTQAVVVADVATLSPHLRVTGASLCFWDFGSGDWLADSSGLIVRTSEGYHIVTVKGEVVALPTPTGAPLRYPDEPLPAPDRSDLFAIGRRVVADSKGNPLAVAALSSDPTWELPADMYPWGLESHELQFALPHLGHGGKCGEDEYLLPARVERPPFGPLVLAAGLPADDCVALRAAPGTGAQVFACLPGGTHLSPAPLAKLAAPRGEPPHYLTPCLAWADQSHWLRLRAPDGQEGWVNAEAGRIGWAE